MILEAAIREVGMVSRELLSEKVSVSGMIRGYEEVTHTSRNGTHSIFYSGVLQNEHGLTPFQGISGGYETPFGSIID